MAKLILASDLISSFQAAKTSYDSKNAKKAVWAAIRTRYGIPSYMTLSCGLDDGPNKGTVWAKGSTPRQYLHVGSDGRYSESASRLAASSVSVNDSAAASSGTFAVADSAANDKHWHVISRDELLEILRDGDAGSAALLPIGFPPQNLGDSALVLNSATGDLYFRA